jgi:large subunit ribosomal protein L25
MTTLKAQTREKSQNVKVLREEGNMPAVLYGAKEDSVSISVSGREFGKVLKMAGESTVITLDTPNGKKSALIHDIQFDPVKSIPVHADFYIVEAGKEVEVDVPLEFVGVSPAVKELGGSLVKVIHELAIKGKPADLPHSIEVDIAVLKDLESNISAGDVTLPKGIVLTNSADDIIASISVAKEEEEEAPSADIADIEVEKKGKQEEEKTEE